MLDRPTITDWRQAKNILCIRLDAMGDVLMTTPAIRALKQSAPGRRITLLTSMAGAQVATLVPEIDQVLVYDAPWMKATGPRVDSRPEYRMAAELNQTGYDGAVIFTVFSQSALPAAFLAYLANIPLRLAHARENPYQLLTHWVPDREWGEGARHEVRRQLDLVATVGAETQNERLSLQLPSGVERDIQRTLSRLGIDLHRPWVVIHPGSTAASRRYPAESYSQAAQMIVEECGIQVLFTGSHQERELVLSVQAEMGAPSFALVDTLDLPHFAGLLGLAPLLISNNTGPVHIAAAMGTPVVDLYALTNPQHTPWMVPSRVLFQDVPCKFCYKSACPEGHHNCLRGVEPKSIVEAACELINESSGFKVEWKLSV